MSNSACTVLSCQISALSTAGNVIGILTFAAGVLVGLIIRARLIANSMAELHVLMDDAELAARQIHRLRVRFEIFSTEQPDDSDVDDLKQLMERETRIVREIECRMDSLKAHNRYSKWEAIKFSMKGGVKQAELTGLVKKAQSLLRELQLGMMQFEQQQMRMSIMQVNGDLVQRSNALYEILLDQTSKLEAETTLSLHSDPEASSQDSSPNSQDILSTTKHPSYQATDLEHQSPVTRPAEEKQTVVLRTQIQNAISRQRDNTSSGRSGDTDPLGTLLRARTMPVETRETLQRSRATQLEGDEDA